MILNSWLGLRASHMIPPQPALDTPTISTLSTMVNTYQSLNHGYSQLIQPLPDSCYERFSSYDQGKVTSLISIFSSRLRQCRIELSQFNECDGTSAGGGIGTEDTMDMSVLDTGQLTEHRILSQYIAELQAMASGKCCIPNNTIIAIAWYSIVLLGVLCL